MPSIIDEVIGKELRPSMLPPTKNVAGELGAKTREMAATNGVVIMDGKRMSFPDMEGSERQIRANEHASAPPHRRIQASYPHRSFNSITVPRGRYNGSTPRPGEAK
jgi:hypothetical protein